MDQTLHQWASGKLVNPRSSDLVSSMSGPTLEKRRGQLAALVSGRGYGFGVGLGEDRAKHRGDHVGVGLGHVR